MKTIKKLKDKRKVYLTVSTARKKRNLDRKKAKLERLRSDTTRDQKLTKSHPEIVLNSSKKFTAGKKGFKNIVVPEKLNLIKNYSETIEFIRIFRQYAIGMRHPIALVFNEVNEISPEALILLLAELYRCRKLFGSNKVTGTYPKNRKIEKLMNDSGFFNLLNVSPRIKKKSKNYPLEYIEFITGNKLIESTASDLRIALLGNKIEMGIIAKKRLFRAVTEAMINVSNHAYPRTKAKNVIRDQWWISGHINKKTNELIILFCDLGVGIPETIPKIHGWERIRAALSILPTIKPNDAEMIKAGMEIGRTRTGVDGRGNGLNDLRKFVDDTGGGELCIFSRKGQYIYRAGQGDSMKNHNYSIGGTLIKWSVPIKNVTNWLNSEVDFESTHD